RVQNVLARQPAVVGSFTGRVEHLGRDDELLPGPEALERAAQHFLARTPGVHVGGVEEVDAQLDGAAEERLALAGIEHPPAPLPRAITHAAETEPRHFETAVAEPDVVHGAPHPDRLAGSPPVTRPPEPPRAVSAAP